MFCVDAEVAEYLKDKNASAVVNQLLLDCMKTDQPKSLEEMEKELKKLEAKGVYLKALEEIDGKPAN